MKQYLVEITLPPSTQAPGSRAPADGSVASLLKVLIVERAYLRADRSGAFLIMLAEDEHEVRAYLSELPFFPFAQVRIVAISDMAQRS